MFAIIRYSCKAGRVICIIVRLPQDVRLYGVISLTENLLFSRTFAKLDLNYWIFRISMVPFKLISVLNGFSMLKCYANIDQCHPIKDSSVDRINKYLQYQNISIFFIKSFLKVPKFISYINLYSNKKALTAYSIT